MGTLEFGCALEPVRRYGDQVTNYQAWCDKIDFGSKTLECQPAVGRPPTAESSSSSDDSDALLSSSFPGQKPFKVSYDKLVM